MPMNMAARTQTTKTSHPAVPAGRYFIISAPPSAPKTMMPSRPMLMTPECSEKQPPRATSIRTEVNTSMY